MDAPVLQATPARRFRPSGKICVMRKPYTVSDGKLVLTLTPAAEGGFVVTSPLEPELVTEADTMEEAFAMARDAVQSLRASRAKLIRKLASAGRRSA